MDIIINNLQLTVTKNTQTAGENEKMIDFEEHVRF